VTLEAAQAAKDKGLAIAMGAPNALRGVSTSGNLSAQDAIAAGLVDMLASDYHPGALLQAAFLIADRGLLSLPQAIALITANPARALGLADRGTLAVGMQADLVLLANHTRPRVCATFREGKQIYSSAFNRLRSVDSVDGC
jgi:alpha-D-ribose 1-methylphosphonate 5-triphosphate diphosphatase